MMRWYLERVAFGLLLALLAAEFQVAISSPHGMLNPTSIGHDYRVYMAAARDWLAGRGFYEAYQLAGPYVVMDSEILYPPYALPLFAVFTFLPAAAWWGIPLGLIAWSIAESRPSLIGWVGILACLAWPQTLSLLGNGNPVIWGVAGVALGLRYGWPSAAILLKPTLAPIALIGARQRSWWIAVGVLAAVSLLLAPMWIDYLTVITNARGPLVSPFYSLGDVPLVLIPVIAYLGSARESSWSGARPSDRVDPIDNHPSLIDGGGVVEQSDHLISRRDRSAVGRVGVRRPRPAVDAQVAVPSVADAR